LLRVTFKGGVDRRNRWESSKCGGVGDSDAAPRRCATMRVAACRVKASRDSSSAPRDHQRYVTQMSKLAPCRFSLSCLSWRRQESDAARCWQAARQQRVPHDSTTVTRAPPLPCVECAACACKPRLGTDTHIRIYAYTHIRIYAYANTSGMRRMRRVTRRSRLCCAHMHTERVCYLLVLLQ